ncbi:hypothetical protein RZN05_02240 [Sphingomonas sp. HF-S4]|uniref:Uncharacterized protein n=1 Tax=Sphingomonas agrestis TaxID=3080540 RepID=A0ABU3Y326_9SPHN|nr:hypothetical protein [Sphingomonas sp. HF-S4]MDV3455788.1 hypothetical protein [Sphingomonas sp. HF-S4]
MKISIEAMLDYQLERPTDILLQIEAAAIPEQVIESANLTLCDNAHFARVCAQDSVGERIWVRAEGRFTAAYKATVSIQRILADCLDLPILPPHQLPGETVQYLMGSRYCPSDQFQSFVDGEFGSIEGGARIIAIRDWVHNHLRYVPGVSTSDTTAADTLSGARAYAETMPM